MPPGCERWGWRPAIRPHALIEAEYVLADISQVTLERLDALAASDWADADVPEVR